MLLIAVNHNKVLLISSIYATCFRRTDHPQAFKYMTLKPTIKCIYVLKFLPSYFLITGFFRKQSFTRKIPDVAKVSEEGI